MWPPGSGDGLCQGLGRIPLVASHPIRTHNFQIRFTIHFFAPSQDMYNCKTPKICSQMPKQTYHSQETASQFNPSIPKRNCSLSLHCNALVLDILNPQTPVKKKSNRSEVCLLVIRSKETFVRCFYPRCGLDRTIVHGLLLGVI